MSIANEYIMKIGLRKIERVNFPKYFIETLKSDDRFKDKIAFYKIPGEKEYRDADKSSNIGFAVGLLAGIGWQKIAQGLIGFKNCNLSHLILKHSEGWSYLGYYAPLKDTKLRSMVFKPEKRGFLGSREIVGVSIDGGSNDLFSKRIRNDRTLLSKILLLLKSGIVWYEDREDKRRFDEIRFTVNRRLVPAEDPIKAWGIIETGLGTNLKDIRQKNINNYDLLAKTSFEVIDSIAGNIGA